MNSSAWMLGPWVQVRVLAANELGWLETKRYPTRIGKWTGAKKMTGWNHQTQTLAGTALNPCPCLFQWWGGRQCDFRLCWLSPHLRLQAPWKIFKSHLHNQSKSGTTSGLVSKLWTHLSFIPIFLIRRHLPQHPTFRLQVLHRVRIWICTSHMAKFRIAMDMFVGFLDVPSSINHHKIIIKSS